MFGSPNCSTLARGLVARYCKQLRSIKHCTCTPRFHPRWIEQVLSSNVRTLHEWTVNAEHFTEHEAQLLSKCAQLESLTLRCEVDADDAEPGFVRELIRKLHD